MAETTRGLPARCPDRGGSPPGIANVEAIAAGRAHSLALASDGTVWAWGDNTFGQLGQLGDGTPREVPATVGGTSAFNILPNPCHQLPSCSSGACVSGTCSDRGVCSNDVCTCEAGHAGPFCEFSDALTCSGQGVAQADGTCTCNGGFAGPACEHSDAVTCSGHGAAQTDGTCTCANGSAGEACEFGDATTCHGAGAAQADGSCSCDEGVAGAQCESCAEGYAGHPECRPVATGTPDAGTEGGPHVPAEPSAPGDSVSTSGCGCQSASGSAAFALFGLLALWRRRGSIGEGANPFAPTGSV